MQFKKEGSCDKNEEKLSATQVAGTKWEARSLSLRARGLLSRMWAGEASVANLVLQKLYNLVLRSLGELCLHNTRRLIRKNSFKYSKQTMSAKYQQQSGWCQVRLMKGTKNGDNLYWLCTNNTGLINTAFLRKNKVKEQTLLLDPKRLS